MQDFIQRCWNDPVFRHWVLPCSIALLIIAAFSITLAHATWKPEYANTPKAVQRWFKDAETTPEARRRLNFILCCEQSERLKTKFVGNPGGEWSYYPDPQCTSAGCPLFPLPNDIVHSERIKAIDPKDDDLPEFEQMRREGVLFIYKGRPTCFWPPESGI